MRSTVAGCAPGKQMRDGQPHAGHLRKVFMRSTSGMEGEKRKRKEAGLAGRSGVAVQTQRGPRGPGRGCSRRERDLIQGRASLKGNLPED